MTDLLRRGRAIETYAKSHGVRLSTTIASHLRQSRLLCELHNLEVGKLIGQGMVDCLKAGKSATRRFS